MPSLKSLFKTPGHHTVSNAFLVSNVVTCILLFCSMLLNIDSWKQKDAVKCETWRDCWQLFPIEINKYIFWKWPICHPCKYTQGRRFLSAYWNVYSNSNK